MRKEIALPVLVVEGKVEADAAACGVEGLVSLAVLNHAFLLKLVKVLIIWAFLVVCRRIGGLEALVNCFNISFTRSASAVYNFFSASCHDNTKYNNNQGD